MRGGEGRGQVVRFSDLPAFFSSYLVAMNEEVEMRHGLDDAMARDGATMRVAAVRCE